MKFYIVVLLITKTFAQELFDHHPNGENMEHPVMGPPVMGPPHMGPPPQQFFGPFGHGAQPLIDPISGHPYIHQSMSGYHHQIVYQPATIGDPLGGGMSGGQSFNGQGDPARFQSFPFGPYSPIFMLLGNQMVPIGFATVQNGIIPAPPPLPPTQPQQQEQEQELQQEQEQQPDDAVSDSRFTKVNPLCKGQFGDVGVCYSDSSCLKERGRPTIYCSNPRQKCCLFNLNCDSESSEEAVHFRNVQYPLPESISKSCGITIKKRSNDICYIRVEPKTLTLPASTGYCHGISFSVSGVTGLEYQEMCGPLTNDVYEVDMRNSNAVTFHVNTDQPIRISWKVLIVQVPCGAQKGKSWPLADGSTPAGPEPPIEPQIPEKGQTGSPGQNLRTCGAPFHRPKKGFFTKSVDSYRGEDDEGDFGIEDEGEGGEQDECSAAEESAGKCFAAFVRGEDPVLTSLEWNVPSVKDSILFKYAGYQKQLTSRITYGAITEPHSYPWSVAMFHQGRYNCGGSLITTKHVLSAAHCLVRHKNNPSTITLKMGDWNINSNTDGVGIVRRARKITTHPGYSTVTLRYDVGVITMDKPVEYSTKLMPICIPHENLDLTGKIVTVTGWGRNENNLLQSILMQHSAAVVDNSECNRRWMKNGAPSDMIASTMLCMDSQDGDSCKGDSGGPCVYEHPPHSNHYYQIGIVSFGSASCTDANLPGVYTRIGSVYEWISEQTDHTTLRGQSFKG